MSYLLGEIFSGAGGLALGAQLADIGIPEERIVHAWANDMNEDACATYRRNLCRTAPETVICKDVRELDFTKLGAIDALAFGFPCNDFTIAGKHKGLDGSYGALYTYGVVALRYFKPKWFLAENVEGLKSANDGIAFKQILQELQESGYSLVPHLYKFEEYGVPQRRHRIIVIGIRSDQDVTFRVPDTAPYKNVDIRSRTALENPPIKEGTANHEKTKHGKMVIERLAHIKPGENLYSADMSEELKVKGFHYSQMYQRLDPERPAWTLTAGGGGGTHGYHYKELRELTNRERARLQTFPDDYVFLGKKESVRKQIGMAVPPMGAKILFEAVLKTFAGIDYPSVPANINIKD